MGLVQGEEWSRRSWRRERGSPLEGGEGRVPFSRSFLVSHPSQQSGACRCSQAGHCYSEEAGGLGEEAVCGTVDSLPSTPAFFCWQLSEWPKPPSPEVRKLFLARAQPRHRLLLAARALGNAGQGLPNAVFQARLLRFSGELSPHPQPSSSGVSQASLVNC